MKIKARVALGLSLLSILPASLALAQSSAPSREIKLSAAAQKILCERFPLNSRCAGNASQSTPSPIASETSTSTDASKNIVEIASENGSFKTLTAALKAADLVSVLEGSGPFTVFAPTDEAFAALPAGTVETLLKPENKSKLVKVLTYHVLPQKAVSSGLKSAEVATVEGSDVKVTVADGGVKVNDAKVVKADIMAKNGVIHVIDKVILPPNM
jgi:uncharacterized surface protein with fasciclin (FAS1) repeats